MTLSDNARGILLMCGSMLAFTVNDSFMKAATKTVPLFQAITLRGLVATVALLFIARMTTGGFNLFPAGRDRRVIALRSVAEVVATALFLTALMHMPLANLSAILQALPLAVTLGAALWLKEPIGWRRMSAIGVGFAGVLLIVRPGTEGFDHWSLMGLASVACVVVRDLSTRTLSRATPSAAVAVWASVAVTGMGLAGVLVQGWQPLSLREAATIGCASLALVVGYLMAVMVMRVGDIGVVAPFRYTSLLWAIVLGWALFGTLPDGLTLIGAAVVVATGLYTLTRERARRRAAAAAAG
ncbi:DMT family transporter [Tabrizicola fusiformis]|uniref:DMT family transporter n=1 Tax=Tabrizicola sp. SY72 TaxID=2741673 RepID=UPI0015743A2F|nr:DMT family transporter [Tabrizicola sp. SY72]NTT86632.1 DMT family transporter [Tabrizicola sp. SY72]